MASTMTGLGDVPTSKLLFGLFLVCFIPSTLFNVDLMRYVIAGTMNPQANEIAFFSLRSNSSSLSQENTQQYEEEGRDRILVVYSGPTDYEPDKWTEQTAGIQMLYMYNFDFFLKHGVPSCDDVASSRQDTLITVGEKVVPYYQARIERLNDACPGNRFVKMAVRDPSCFDYESVRMTLKSSESNPIPIVDGLSSSWYFNSSVYDYFFHVNCGTTGPAPALSSSAWWTQRYLHAFQGDASIRLVGLSHNCLGGTKPPHVQTMVYALDKTAFQLLMQNPDAAGFGSRPIFFECNPTVIPSSQYRKKAAVDNYEIGMSNYFQSQGYRIQSLVRGKVFPMTPPPTTGNTTNTPAAAVLTHERCMDRDLWRESSLRSVFNDTVPTLEQVQFFKTSRLLPKDIADQIGFQSKPSWHWGR